MKKWVFSLVVLVVVLSGCSESTKVQTPPWSEKEIKQMEQDDVKCVPFAILRF
jgi:PBP1b-binding outer membrane lipoprotein LpoB